MKGVLFSADFAKDVNGDLKLLELNTNTVTSFPEDFDYSELQQLITDNSIDTLHLVYTSAWHSGMVESLQAFAEGLNLTVEKSPMAEGTLFLPEVTENETTLVLRLAYDEASIFDSEYAAYDINTLKLFTDGVNDNLVVPYYYKDLSGEYSTISSLHTNPANLPDYVVKAASHSPNGVEFVKTGTPVSDAEKLQAVKQLTNGGANYITAYLQSPEDLQDNKVDAYRFYGITYTDSNNEPTFLTLGAYKVQAILEIAEELDAPHIVNTLAERHFFEYSTNFPKLTTTHGVPFNEVMKLDTNEQVLASEIQTGSVVDTYAMDTVPAHEDYSAVLGWYVSGSQVPTISNSSATVMTAVDAYPKHNVVSQIELEDGSSTLVGLGSYIVRYSPSEDNFKFVSTVQLKPGDQVLLNGDNKVGVVSSNLVVLKEETFVRSFDVEDIDLYVVGENNLLMHNSPCFVEGTQIELEEGNLAIEFIQVGDKIKTYNHNTQQIEIKTVQSILKKEDQLVVHYSLDNGTDLYATHDHPIFVEGKGYASYNPTLTLEDSQLTVAQLEEGDVVKLVEGTATVSSINPLEGPLTVYNLSDVEDNHNFFANKVLVHNRVAPPKDQPCPDCCPSFGGAGSCEGCSGTTDCCIECFDCLVAGTEVTLSNGDVKNIEDVVAGDEVLSSSVFTGQQEAQEVLEAHKSETRVLVTTVLENGAVLKHTQEHPHINANGVLVSYRPDVTKAKVVYESDKPVRQLEVGTVLLTEEGKQVKVVEVSVEEFDHYIDTFIIKVKENANFYANGILTHNK